MASFRTLTPVLALVLGLAAAPLAAQAKVLAKVDGVEITDADAQAAAEDLGAALPQHLQGPQREAYLVEYLIDAKLVARHAEKEKFGEGPDFARKLEFQRQKIMMEALLTKVAKDATSDEALRKVYEEALKAQKPEEEAHARHILVPTEDEAKAVVKRLEGGEDFVKVATEVSKDPGSPGGDLGWFTREKMVPEFSEAAFKLEKGKLSAPIKSQFGWHVIRLEDKRQKPFPGFDQVKDQVERYVQQKAQAELIMKLREGAKIERTDAPPAEAPKKN
ncbi:MAG: peptidylprolyl isomerase [Hyphomicrobiaceae bacterium]|nr:peptidylprolyl isomerase [Hyphomicrobiaceae bacterium]